MQSWSGNPGVPGLGTGTLPPGHRATAIVRSLEVKIWREQSERVSPRHGEKFKGRTETSQKECNRTTGLTGRWRGRQAVMAVVHSGNQSEIKSWTLTVTQTRWAPSRKQVMTQRVRQGPEIGTDHTTGQQQWAPLGSLVVFFNFLFYIGIYLINNIVLVWGIRQSDSVIRIHASILFQISFPN